MKGFWSNEWDLFLNDMQELGDFFLQPVTFDGLFQDNDLMLKPTNEEIEEKAETGGFWANEFDLFLKDLDSVADFLFQPINLK